MLLQLQSLSRSFATRSKAREIAGEIRSAEPIGPVTLDMSSVFASPSFLAELLQCLASQGDVTIIGADAYLAHTLIMLVDQLGLQQRVAIQDRALVR